MDNKDALARKETERQSMLLASTGIGRIGKETPRRDKRKKAHSPSKRRKGTKAIVAEEESQNSTVDKGRDGKGREQKYRQDNKSRKDTGGGESKNRTSRRSATELGIVWGDSYCSDRPTAPHAHHWMSGNEVVEKGYIFHCKYCLRTRWIPMHITDSRRMQELMVKYGTEEGYLRVLNNHPVAKKLLAKLADIWALRRQLPDKQYQMAVAAIMGDKEYPYEEEA